MQIIIKAFSLLLCTTLLLAGCIGYPISEEVSEFEHSGDIAGTKSNADEKIVGVGIAYGTQWVLSAEGPRRQVNRISSEYEYYLDKKGSRMPLPFLNIGNKQARWNVFANINNRWFAVNVDANTSQILVIQFDSHGDEISHDINVAHTGAISEMYLERETNYLVWKEINNGYHQYSLITREKSPYNKASSPVTDKSLIKMPGIEPGYDDIEFSDVVKPHGDRSRYSRAHKLFETKSIKFLRQGSDSRYYQERWAVALNPNTPKGLLEKLSYDSSYYVANAAKKRLASTKQE